MTKKTRLLTEEEREVVVALINASNSKWDYLKKHLSYIMVREMSDGGMGSLLFKSECCDVRKLGVVVSEAEFNDNDGVLVSIVLNLDEDNRLFELDVWKVDFSKLIKFPNVDQLRFVS